LQRQEDAPQTWFVQLSNPFINDLRLYARSGSGFEVAQAGDQFAFAQRAQKFRFPVFALAFPDTGVQTFYLRLQSDSSLAGALELWQPDALREKARHENFYFSAVLGMLCMSFLISMVHGLHDREPKVLLFAALTMTIFLQVAAGLGLLAEYLMPTWPMLADLLVPWSLALSTVCCGLVFGRALNIAANFPRLLRFIQIASILALLAPLSRYIGQYNSWGGPMLQLLSLLIFCATGWVSWRRWRARAEGAAYFLIAHGFLIGSMLMGRLILMGWLPANLFNQLSWVPGLLIYIFLVHAGIFVDSHSVKRERNAALAETQAAQGVLLSERALREEQSVFFAFVAHELRSPLAAILTGLKNLENECAGMQHALLQRTRRIKVYAEGMGRVIDRHLSLQRLSSAEFAPEFAHVEVRQLAEESLRRVQALFTDRLFVADYAADLPACIWGDADLLHMALDNVLTNAAVQPRANRHCV
jgi:signal transduction histidine kinase